jgi:hypothetical protein
VPVQRLRVALVLEDLEEDVGRPPGAVLGVDRRRADDPIRVDVDQDEQVFALEDRDLTVEGAARGLEDAGELVTVVREVDRVEVARDRDELDELEPTLGIKWLTQF